ncbi:MAG: tetratricopeptide repeat protein, partial [Planctomycetes bacterium]|nr:tetratricopeptide repeat protein [Planctomycetota bacterium]
MHRVRGLIVPTLWIVSGALAAAAPQTSAPLQGNPSQLRSHARELITLGESETALAILLALDENEPNQVDTLLLVGEAYYALDRYADAISYFERGLALAPQLRERAFNLGRSYELSGRYDEAERAFLPMAHSEDPATASKGHFGLGLVFEGRGDRVEALRLYRKALEFDETNHRARYKIALEELRTGALEAAAEGFRAVLARRPLHHGAAYNLSLALRRQGKIGEADAALERWRKIKSGKER